MLPQRRRRVWGLAYLINGLDDEKTVEVEYRKVLDAMMTNWQFPPDKLFLDRPPADPSLPRLAALVEAAKKKYPFSKNVFIDASSSLDWEIMGDGVDPR